MRIDNATRGELILDRRATPLTQSKSCGVTAGIIAGAGAAGPSPGSGEFLRLIIHCHSGAHSPGPLKRKLFISR